MIRKTSILARSQVKWLSLPGNVRGIVWITLGTIAFALNDVLVKLLGKKFGPMELAFCRYFVGVLLFSPIFIRMGIKGLKTNRIGIHMFRLAIACIGQLGVFYSVIHLYLADATAIAFSRPLFTTIIAVVVLSELVSTRRWAATIVGFVGVLIMVRPGHAGFDPVAIVALLSAFIFAVGNVLIRLMATTEPPNRILFYYHTGGAIIFLVPIIILWQTPVGIEWALLAGIGVMTTIGMIGFIRAFSVGEINAVGPMEYTRVIYAGLLGYSMFGETPNYWTLVGATIIILATVYIAREEAHKNAT